MSYTLEPDMLDKEGHEYAQKEAYDEEQERIAELLRQAEQDSSSAPF